MRIQTAGFDFVEMLAEPFQHVGALPFVDFPFHFVEREMHDIVMMQFLMPQFVAQFQPNLMQQIDFLRRKPRRMRPQIKNLLRARRRSPLTTPPCRCSA